MQILIFPSNSWWISNLELWKHDKDVNHQRNAMLSYEQSIFLLIFAKKEELYALYEVSNSSNKAWTIDRFFSNMQQKNLELIYLRKSKDLWTNLSKTHFILFSILKGGISVAIVYFDLPVAKFSWHSGKNKLVWYNVMSYHYKKEVEEKKQTRPE